MNQKIEKIKQALTLSTKPIMNIFMVSRAANFDIHAYTGVSSDTLNSTFKAIHAFEKALRVALKSSIYDGANAFLGDTHREQRDMMFFDGAVAGSTLSDNDVSSCMRFKNLIIDELLTEYNSFCKESNIGYVYLIEGTHNGKTMYKIGKANDLTERLRKFEVVIPFDIKLIYAVSVQNPLLLESMLHDHFKEYRVSGEWFDFDTYTAMLAIFAMYHTERFCGGFIELYNDSLSFSEKLNDSEYIEYLESLMAFNGIDFDKTKRRNANG